jgi:hypothetical protein
VRLFFNFLNTFLKELSTAIKIRCWSCRFTRDLTAFSKCPICWWCEVFIKRWNCILSRKSAVLARCLIYVDLRLMYGDFSWGPFGITLWNIYLIRKVTWLRVLANRIFAFSNFLNIAQLECIASVLSTQFPPTEASSIDRTQQSMFTWWRVKTHPSKRSGCKT